MTNDQGRLVSSKQASTAETTYGGFGADGQPDGVPADLRV